MYCYRCMKDTAEGSHFCSYCGQDPRVDNQPHQLHAGTVLYNRYLVGNVLGEGGFGITYIGFDMKLAMRVAIKEFYPNGFANRNSSVTNDVTLNLSKDIPYFANAKEKYLQEAQSIAKFSEEQGIVDVRDYFEENNTAYIIMEYLEGMDLAQRLREEGTFSPTVLFKQMIPVMYSLSRVHKAKIIHRDIAPDNIKMTADGSFKLMDFGAARIYAGDNKKSMSVTTKQGFTPYEQYSNGEQGPWTDVYGLCATIYKCITGKTPVDSLKRITNDTLKKPSELGIGIPQSLENVLMYGLAVFPDNRCKSMGELMGLTERALRGDVINVGGVSGMEQGVQQVKSQDDMYKTMFSEEQVRNMQGAGYGGNGAGGGQGYGGRGAGNGYGGNGAGNGYGAGSTGSGRGGQSGNGYGAGGQSGNSGRGSGSGSNSGKKKSGSGMMILGGVLGVLVLVLLIALGTAIMGDKDKKDNDSGRKVETSDSKADSNDEDSEDEDDGLMVEVPDVTGMREDEAKTTLLNAGLDVKSEYQENQKVSKGDVIKQDVEAGTKVEPGETVTIYVSKGMETSEETGTTENTGSRASASTGSSSNSNSGNSDYGNFPSGFVAPKGRTPGNGDILYCCARDFVALRNGPSTSSSEILRIQPRVSMICKGISANQEFYLVEYTSGGTVYTGYASTRWTSTDPNEPYEY